jgi:two-component system chemotaxis response regulator CheY
MIVDDSKFARNILKDILKKEGFDVIAEAVNGLEAIELTKQKRPDFIFLDVEMPMLDGIGAIPKILEVDSQVHIIMCTAMGQKNIIVEAARAGAKDYVLKPYKKENITRVLSAFIESQPVESQVIPFYNPLAQYIGTETDNITKGSPTIMNADLILDCVDAPDHTNNIIMEIIPKPIVMEIKPKQIVSEPNMNKLGEVKKDASNEPEKTPFEVTGSPDTDMSNGSVDTGMSETFESGNYLEPLVLDGDLEDVNTEDYLISLDTEGKGRTIPTANIIKPFTHTEQNSPELQSAPIMECYWDNESDNVDREVIERMKSDGMEEDTQGVIPFEELEAYIEETLITNENHNSGRIEDENPVHVVIRPEEATVLKPDNSFDYLWKNRFAISQGHILNHLPTNQRKSICHVADLSSDGYNHTPRQDQEKNILAGLIGAYLCIDHRMKQDCEVPGRRKFVSPAAIRLFSVAHLPEEIRSANEITMADILKEKPHPATDELYLQKSGLYHAISQLVQSKTERMLG